MRILLFLRSMGYESYAKFAMASVLMSFLSACYRLPFLLREEESGPALDRSSPVSRAAVMDDNLRLFYGEYGGRLERQLADLTERFSDRINEDPSLKSVILFFVISFVLLAFLILFISLFLAVGCICVLTYFCMITLSSFTGGVTRD